MNLTTPALLFPAISLLLLAYTNRFLVIAQLVRQLNLSKNDKEKDIVVRQMPNLRLRLSLIKNMQILGVGSFLLCALSMFFEFIDYKEFAFYLFGVSLVALCLSLVVSLWEVVISTNAIKIELEGMEKPKKVKRLGIKSNN